MFQLSLIILADFQSFTVNRDKLQNCSISRFMIRSWYSILVKIWKWLKLLHSVPFIKNTYVNDVYIRIWSVDFTKSVDFHSFTVNEDKLQN